MKKRISCVLIFALLLSLAACGNQPATPTTVPATTPAQPETTIDDIDLKTMLYLFEDISGLEIGTYCYQQEISPDTMPAVLGSEGFDLPFAEGRAYLPTLNTTAFVLAVFRLEEGADTQVFMDELKARANPDRWICVRAEVTETACAERTVMFVMSDGAKAKQLADTFSQMSQPGFRVADHLVDRLAGLNMTDIYSRLYRSYGAENYGFMDGEDYGEVTPHTGYGLSELDHGMYTDSLLDIGGYPADEYDGERAYLLVMFRLGSGADAADFAQELKSSVDTTGLKGEGQQYLLAWGADVVVYYVGTGSLAWSNSALDYEFAGHYRMETEGAQP